MRGPSKNRALPSPPPDTPKTDYGLLKKLLLSFPLGPMNESVSKSPSNGTMLEPTTIHPPLRPIALGAYQM